MLREKITILVGAAVAALAAAPPATAAAEPLKPGIIDANPHEGIVRAGQPFAIKVVARNVDTRWATAVQPLVFHLSNTKSVKGARKVGAGSIPSLPKKTSRAVFDFSIAIPSNVKPGGYRLLVCRPVSGKLPHCSKTIKLSVRAPLPPKLKINITETDFGTHAIGVRSMDEAYVVTNTGGSRSGTLATTLIGADPGEFTKLSDGCNGRTLIAGASCTVKVAAEPTEARLKADPETPLFATLRVGATSGGFVTAALSAQGTSPVTLEVTPTHDFGEVVFGAVSAPHEFTVKNTGIATSGPLNVISSGPDGSQFEVLAAGNTCAGAILAPNATCVVSARFAPQPVLAGGLLDATGYLRAIDTSWEVPWGLLAYGDGVMTGQMRTLTISPDDHDYGSAEALEESEEQSFTVTNHSGLDVTGAAVVTDGPQASVVNIKPGTTCGATLAAGASCQIVITISPTAGGPQQAQVGYRGQNQGPTVDALATVTWVGV